MPNDKCGWCGSEVMRSKRGACNMLVGTFASFHNDFLSADIVYSCAVRIP